MLEKLQEGENLLGVLVELREGETSTWGACNPAGGGKSDPLCLLAKPQHALFCEGMCRGRAPKAVLARIENVSYFSVLTQWIILTSLKHEVAWFAKFTRIAPRAASRG